MSSNKVAHVSSVDKGLKMKIKRTKGPNRVDSKHEVVKSEPVAKLAAVTTPGQPVSVTTSSPTSASLPAVNTSCGPAPATSVADMFTAPVAASLPSLSSSPSSSLLSSSSSNSLTPSNGTAAGSNAMSTLQKAGSLPEAFSSNNMAGSNRSPLKTISPSASGLDAKSPKTKAAYNKKVKDSKGKADGFLPIGNASAVNGSNIASIDTRTSICVTNNIHTFNSASMTFTSQAGVSNSIITSEPRPGDTVHMKRENPVHDPYEFNAKVEDKIELPPKKLKLEKTECIETAVSPQPQPLQHLSPPLMLNPTTHSKQQQQQQQQLQLQQQQLQLQQPPQKRSVGVDVRSIGVLTDPDSLGPCEPGTQVGLEGIVWKETDNGLLVVNVTWRGKTYVGTLMDATRYAWAPPRPNGCESPVTDFETRTPKGRGKRNCRNSVPTSERLPEGRRLRKGRRGTVNSSSSNFTAPPSPVKSDVSNNNNMKRRSKPNDVDNDKSKKSRPCSRGDTGTESPTPDGYIVCPEPNCQKKYKHMNGLRYHRTHAHRKSSLTDDTKDEEEEDDDDEEKHDKKEKATVSERAERMKSKEKQRGKEQHTASEKDTKDSVDNDIPLKDMASKASGQFGAHDVDVAKTVKDGEQGHDPVASCNDPSSPSASGKAEPQILPTKADVSSHKDSGSPVTTPGAGCKTTEPSTPDASDSSVSVVPSVSPLSETPRSLVTNSTNSNSIDLSSLTTALSQACSPSPVTVQTSHCPSVATAQTLPLKTSAVRQTAATTTSTSVLGLTTVADKQHLGKHSHPVQSTVRPIVPAPSLQLAGVSSPYPHSVSSVLFSQSQCCTLKPIQPKPTIMGDYPTSNPALCDLSKEKARKSKKKKDHTEARTVSTPVSADSKSQMSLKECNRTVFDLISQDNLYRHERKAVIKNSNLSEPLETSSPGSDVSKSAFQSSMSSSKQQCFGGSDHPATVGTRASMPPSSLPVYSGGHNKSAITDDVHSPAYSDISDANDSNSPFQQDSPRKDSPAEKDPHINGPLHLGQDTNTLSQHYGNMFYFGGASNYLQHGAGNQTSPNLTDVLKNKDNLAEKASRSNENSYDKKEGGRCLQETELQQKSLFNYFAQLHGMTPSSVHLQYNHTGYMSTAADPSYTNLAPQGSDQHKQLPQHEQTFTSEDDSGKSTSSGNSHMNRTLGSGYMSGAKQRAVSDTSESHVDQRLSDDDNSPTVHSRQDDSRQTLKEGLEFKPHAELGQDKHSNQTAKRHQNNLLHRAHGYSKHKQNMFEHQNKRKSPPGMSTACSHLPSPLSGLMSRSTLENKLQDLIPPESIKKECVSSEDRPRSETTVVGSKQIDTKDGVTQQTAKSSPLEVAGKPRSPSQSSTPGIPQSGSSMSSSSSSTTTAAPLSVPAAALPVSLVNSLPGTGATFPFSPYYPHFRPVQMEPIYSTLSPHIIGYTSNGPHGYIHPNQLGYRLPLAETDKKSLDSAECTRSDESARLANNTGYHNSHKVHDHPEKSRPSTRELSPAPNKATNVDSLRASSSVSPDSVVEKIKDKQREYTSSPPTQRHVHTHHHTHVVSGFPPLYTPDTYSKLMKF